MLKHFSSYPSNAHFLDLGCGNGRNAIPLAKLGYQLTAIDLLPEAISVIRKTCQAQNLSLVTEISSIEEFSFDNYNGIFAVSTLEHVSSVPVLKNTLQKIKQAVKPNGSIYFVINSEVTEQDLTGAEVTPFLEINLSTDSVITLLGEAFHDWPCNESIMKELDFLIQRSAGMRKMNSKAITFIAKKI
ncbi:class I SAM-dependent methyltransferase [Enterococcus sp. LJL99]